MGRMLERDKIKMVLDALRIRPMRWKELVSLGIPEKSLERVLKDYLRYWGLVEKNDEEYWVLREHTITFKNREEYELVLKHSRTLALGLENILSEWGDLWFFDKDGSETAKELWIKDVGHQRLRKWIETTNKESFMESAIDKGTFLHFIWVYNYVYREGKLLRSLAEDHLRTGYPDFYEKLLKYRKIRKKKQQHYIMLSNEIRVLELGIKMGVPLKGFCKMCPKIKFEK